MVNNVLEFVNSYGIIAIFVAIMIEYACFPLPSEVILPLSGALAFNNNINFFYILLISVIAGLIGSLICYLIGLTGGNKVLSLIIKIYPKSERGIKEAEIKYRKYSSLSVSLGRVIPLCRTYISFVAGISKQNILKYITYTTIGITLWNSILIFLGYKFYENLDIVYKIYSDYKLVIIFIVLVIVIGVLFIKLFKYLIKKNKG